MAEKKTNKTTKSNTKSSGGWGLNKISLYVIVAVALLYLVSLVLSLVGVNFKIVVALQGLATAIMICIVAVLAWRYVAKKNNRLESFIHPLLVGCHCWRYYTIG